uniref:DNA meiotic recombinase 1 n=1 Tax=Mus spicilegus TaxID=10103 RepID=A0A8C6GB39_MUSSI
MKEDQVVQEESGFQDDEESLFQDIDLLQKHGINMADIKKLKSVGICTIKGIQMTTRRALCNVKGLSEAKVEKIKEAANKLINFVLEKLSCLIPSVVRTHPKISNTAVVEHSLTRALLHFTWLYCSLSHFSRKQNLKRLCTQTIVTDGFGMCVEVVLSVLYEDI